MLLPNIAPKMINTMQTGSENVCLNSTSYKSPISQPAANDQSDQKSVTYDVRQNAQGGFTVVQTIGYFKVYDW